MRHKVASDLNRKLATFFICKSKKEREDFIMAKEKSEEVLKAEAKVKQAQANLKKVKQEEKRKLEKEREHHKFMMGGCVAKYFPECYGFDEKEMNRIIACAFVSKDVLNMIEKVVSERPAENQKNAESEVVEDAEDGGENE